MAPTEPFGRPRRRHDNDLSRPHWRVSAAVLQIVVAGLITVLVIGSTTLLAVEHRIDSNAAVAILTAALGYAWGAYTAERAGERRRQS